jgi:uncharacterized protein (TIGR02284 family)
MMADKNVTRELNDLYRLCQAGEKGFRVAAESVKNRGLKLLFKSHAEQRARFATALAEAMGQRGRPPAAGSGLLAVLHRGWIRIRAALTLGDEAIEDFVLAEALRGESAAVSGYERALGRGIGEGVRQLVEGQYQAVSAVRQQMARLRGATNERLVVRLFDSGPDLEQALSQLDSAGIPRQHIETVTLSEAVAIYKDTTPGSAVAESASAGAFGGAIVGALIGAVAGASPLLFPQLDAMLSMGGAQFFVLTVLLGLLAGLFFGGLGGALIGRGVAEEDTFLYADGVVHGHALVMVQTEPAKAREAARIMRGVNAARHHPWHELEPEVAERSA